MLRSSPMQGIKTRCVNVPEQTNHCDCGLFVLKYTDALLQEMPALDEITKLVSTSSKKPKHSQTLSPEWCVHVAPLDSGKSEKWREVIFFFFFPSFRPLA